MQNKKNPKADIGRNSSLYFAVGLALMMFLSYGAINYKVYDKDISYKKRLYKDIHMEIDLHGYSLDDANKKIEELYSLKIVVVQLIGQEPISLKKNVSSSNRRINFSRKNRATTNINL